MAQVEITEEVIGVLEIDETNVSVVTETVTQVVEIGILGPQGIPGQDSSVPGPPGTLVKEVPSGLIDGANDVFTTSAPFVPGSTQFYLNGLLQDDPGDYTETSSDEVTFVDAPLIGDSLLIIYTPEA